MQFGYPVTKCQILEGRFWPISCMAFWPSSCLCIKQTSKPTSKTKTALRTTATGSPWAGTYLFG